MVSIVNTNREVVDLTSECARVGPHVDLVRGAGNANKAPLVELKNGKLVFKQKPLSLEKNSETMQGIVSFREMVEDRIEKKEEALTAIPEGHLPLIAKLVHESDKTLHTLAKHIQSELIPVNDSSSHGDATSILALGAVEQAIKTVAMRSNYGLENTSGSGRVPAALNVWRWEVKQNYMDRLPKGMRDRLETRSAERRQAKQDAQTLFDALSEEEQNALLGTTRTPLKAKLSAQSSEEPTIMKGRDAEVKNMTQQPQPTANDKTASNAPGRPKKPVDPEKVAKDKEKLEKKVAKAEKEKKELEAQSKSRSMMASFFGKAKAPSIKRDDAPQAGAGKDASPGVAGPSSSTTQSDFGRTFKPFVSRKDVELAPANWFEFARQRRCISRSGMEGEIIAFDDFEESEEEQAPLPHVDLAQLTDRERLLDVLSQLRPSLLPIKRPALPLSHLKTYCPRSVRNIMAKLSEAEVTDDDEAVRALLALLGSRAAIPAKVLIFTEDARPGYFGTWTRSSREVGPRTPFTRDVISLDYSYDSGEEWEEESGDADDVVEDAEEDEGGEDGEDSDMDSWLVDDDDADVGIPEEERVASPNLIIMDAPPPPAKRKKAGTGEAKESKKRKVVVPLVPFTKGPCWEERIGHCEYKPFEAYRIELFNDTPHPINPFTFVAANAEMPTSTRDVPFAVPALPPRLVGSSAQQADFSSSTHPSIGPGPSTSTAPKKPAITAKTTFPDAHLPILLTKINSLATPNLAYIVETVYQDLREQRVKKNAIEAKVKEVGEKCKMQRIWIIKPEVKAAHGLA